MKTTFNYITTNIINKKQYVGIHSTENINDNYLGSGYAILKAIKKYGKQNFKREILCFCDDVSTAHYNEECFINEHKTYIPYGYNISPKGGHQVAESMSEETKKKISQTMKGNTNHKNICHSEETKRKIGLKSKGRTHSQETKIKIGEYQQKTWEEKLGKERTKKLKQKYSEKFKGNKISFKEIDLCLAETLLKEGKSFREVAQILNISTTTFNYKFREIYNMTPYEYSKKLNNFFNAS